MPTDCLPDNPDLGRLKAHAKTLRDLVRAGVEGSVALVRDHHPRYANLMAGTPEATGFKLALLVNWLLIGPSPCRRIHHLDPFPQPVHDIDSHAVAQRLVARPIRRPASPPVGHVGVVIREPLQALAFARRQTAHGPGGCDVGPR